MIRDHQRAIAAHRHVSEVEKETRSQPDDRTAYGSICHKLPILVHQQGLAPALHFVDALRSKPYKRRLLEHLAKQLKEAGMLTEGTREELLERARTADVAELFTLTREVTRCLEWYRRFAHSILDVDTTSEGG